MSRIRPQCVEVCHPDWVFLNNTSRTSLGERRTREGIHLGRMRCTSSRTTLARLTRMTSLFFFVPRSNDPIPHDLQYKKQCTTIRENPESDRDGGVHCISPRHPQVRFVDILALGRSGQAFRASSSLCLDLWMPRPARMRQWVARNQTEKTAQFWKFLKISEIFMPALVGKSITLNSFLAPTSLSLHSIFGNMREMPRWDWKPSVLRFSAFPPINPRPSARSSPPGPAT